MKLYNSPLTGQTIYIAETTLSTDMFVEVSEERGYELLKEYPFLVNADLPQYKPSFWVKTRPTLLQRIRNSFARRWRIIKTNLVG